MNIPKKYTIILLIIFSSTIAGCTTRHIRDAQDSFNKAAKIENEITLQSYKYVIPSLESTDYSIALAEYKQALLLLEKELEDNRSKLESENLLGTVYMLEILSLWRIMDLERDVTEDVGYLDNLENKFVSLQLDISKSQKENKVMLGTRDKVLFAALPGLFDHDKGMRATDLSTSKRMFSSAYEVLDESVKIAPRDHPVRIYIRFSQLQTLTAWDH